MLIEFSGEHSGSVIMFGKAATAMLKMMGLSGNSEGAISAPDVPVALEKLESALSNLPEEEPDAEDEDGEREISLRTRAIPLIKILKENVAGSGYVTWKPQ